MAIENTAERSPMVHLGGMLGGNVSGYIEGMEAAGQTQLVNSDRLPTDDYGKQAEFEALGFTFGEPDPADPMFRPATLPEGWKREGSDHAMWSYIVDERGLRRVGIFYKAAFYDRSAHMSMTNVGSALASEAIYTGEDPAETVALLTDDERAEYVEALRRTADESSFYDEDCKERARSLLAASGEG